MTISNYKLTCTRLASSTKITSSFSACSSTWRFRRSWLYFMRYNQTEKLIGELSLANRQKRKLVTGTSRQNSSGNEGKTAAQVRFSASHHENLITSPGNVLLINLRLWKKRSPVLCSATQGLKRIILRTNLQETVDLRPLTPLTTNRSRENRRLII